MIIWKKCSLPTRAEKEAAAQKQQEREKLPETVAALRAALDDADAMTVDHEYRLALLEYGITDNA